MKQAPKIMWTNIDRNPTSTGIKDQRQSEDNRLPGSLLDWYDCRGTAIVPECYVILRYHGELVNLTLYDCTKIDAFLWLDQNVRRAMVSDQRCECSIRHIINIRMDRVWDVHTRGRSVEEKKTHGGKRYEMLWSYARLPEPY